MSNARLDERLVRRLHERANADRWAVPLERFTSALELSVARGLSGQPASTRDTERYLSSLHLADLALACACADGHEEAWEHFVREHRPVLYRAADAIDNTGGARDLADSLYADLFGLNERDGTRQSLFRYFHGRSSLATWLRAVLAQRHVDRVRSGRRLDPLPDDDASPAAVGSSASSADPERPRFLASMQRAVTAAVAELAPRDRLRLACYYAQDLTLSQIGRLLSEHEATSSRHLARSRRAIRESVERRLTEEGMTQAELSDCFSSVVDDAGALDLAEMLGGESTRKKSGSDRST